MEGERAIEPKIEEVKAEILENCYFPTNYGKITDIMDEGIERDEDEFIYMGLKNGINESRFPADVYFKPKIEECRRVNIMFFTTENDIILTRGKGGTIP